MSDDAWILEWVACQHFERMRLAVKEAKEYGYYCPLVSDPSD